jgi:hypothetical protein
MRGLTLRITNTSSTAQSFADLPAQPILAVGESRELLYSDDVQASLEYGSINALVLAGKVSVQFTNGTALSQAAIGRTFTGASPTAAGTPGLVPTAQPANRTGYLKGDGTWTGITPTAIGAIPESKLTTQGDLLFRGVITSERLPLGTFGQSLRAGVVNPEWATTALSGTLAARPIATAYYQGVYYWATDASSLTICYYDGSSWLWASVISPPGITRKEIPSPETVLVPNGSQYICYDSLTLFGTATLVLQGNADLVILDEPPVPWSGVLPTATLTTNNAVTQTLSTIPTTVNQAHFYDITVNAYRTDLSAQVAFKVWATVTNAAGVVTVRDVVITPTDPGTAWVVAVTASAPNVLVQVTGDAGPPNVRWNLAGTAQVN